MGQQQLLLLVLSTIIVGVSIVVGIGMFQDSAMNANIDTVTQECVTIASKASEWWNKSEALGGGGGAFNGTGRTVDLQLLGYSNVIDTTDVGIFTIASPTANTVEVIGITQERDDNDARREVTTTLTMDAVNGSATISSLIAVLP